MLDLADMATKPGSLTYEVNIVILIKTDIHILNHF